MTLMYHSRGALADDKNLSCTKYPHSATSSSQSRVESGIFTFTHIYI